VQSLVLDFPKIAELSCWFYDVPVPAIVSSSSSELLCQTPV
jgi:hypothetical protein